MTASIRHGVTSFASLVLTAAFVAALSGCGGIKTPGSAPDESGPTSSPPPSQPAPAPAPPPPPTAAQQAQAQKAAQGVIELLEVGNEEQARSELQAALALDPNNKLAQNLMRQMTEDPMVALGKESFPYVVRGGDTLSRIAGTYLGDIYAFHILARYNNIKVPRQVAAGQTIRIPGKAPAASAQTPREPAPSRADRRPAAEPAPAPAPAVVPPPPAEASAAEVAYRSGEAANKAGMYEKALADYKRAASLGHPTAGAQADATAKRLIDIHSRNAHAAMARQDLDGAIRSWDRVLEIDPNNETARLEKQKALRLKDKIKALPG
ncbi:LysM peptidoglycan-binding domain-containing protein [Sphaerotilaceae bacterium SBD11-9]